MSSLPREDSFTREEIEIAISRFEDQMDRYVLKVHRTEPRRNAFLLGCHDLENKNYYLLERGVDGSPTWNNVHENLMPDWWNSSFPAEEDFCQEDIDAAADYIASS